MPHGMIELKNSAFRRFRYRSLVEALQAEDVQFYR